MPREPQGPTGEGQPGIGHTLTHTPPLFPPLQTTAALLYVGSILISNLPSSPEGETSLTIEVLFNISQKAQFKVLFVICNQDFEWEISAPRVVVPRLTVGNLDCFLHRGKASVKHRATSTR